MENESAEVRTEDIPVIPNPRAASAEEMRRIWQEAVKNVPSQPHLSKELTNEQG